MIEEGFAERSGPKARWLRIREDVPEVLTIVEKNFVNFYGHYWDRKMRLCNGKNCRFCMAGIGAQRRYCFDVVVVTSGEQMLFETSESVANQIRDIIELDRRGERIYFEVRRMSPSKHSNCIVKRVTPEVNRQFEQYAKQKLKEIYETQEECFKRYDEIRKKRVEIDGPGFNFKEKLK